MKKRLHHQESDGLCVRRPEIEQKQSGERGGKKRTRGGQVLDRWYTLSILADATWSDRHSVWGKHGILWTKMRCREVQDVFQKTQLIIYSVSLLNGDRINNRKTCHPVPFTCENSTEQKYTRCVSLLVFHTNLFFSNVNIS